MENEGKLENTNLSFSKEDEKVSDINVSNNGDMKIDSKKSIIIGSNNDKSITLIDSKGNQQFNTVWSRYGSRNYNLSEIAANLGNLKKIISSDMVSNKYGSWFGATSRGDHGFYLVRSIEVEPNNEYCFIYRITTDGSSSVVGLRNAVTANLTTQNNLQKYNFTANTNKLDIYLDPAITKSIYGSAYNRPTYLEFILVCLY